MHLDIDYIYLQEILREMTVYIFFFPGALPVLLILILEIKYSLFSNYTLWASPLQYLETKIANILIA